MWSELGIPRRSAPRGVIHGLAGVSVCDVTAQKSADSRDSVTCQSSAPEGC